MRISPSLAEFTPLSRFRDWRSTAAMPTDWRKMTVLYGPRCATWAIGLALALQSVAITVALAREFAPVPQHSAPNTGPAPWHPNVQLIVNEHLFGSAAPDEAQATRAVATNTSLQLTGLIAANDPQGGLAILGETTVNTKLFAVGEAIPGGGRLRSVYVDYVVIERDGRLEQLRLPDPGTPRTAGQAPGPRVARLSDPEQAPEETQALAAAPAGGSRLVDVMHARPVIRNGRTQGFQLSPGTMSADFQRYGLRAGDVLTEVDGAPLDTTGHALQLLRDTRASSRPRLTVIRDGVTQTVVLGSQ